MPKTKMQSIIYKQERKKNIALAGLKVFCSKGYDSTTVDDIVKKAGCSHGLFYHYFTSKKEVFEEVMKIKRHSSTQKMQEELDKIPTCADKLKFFVDQTFNQVKTDENFAYYFYFFLSQSFNYKEKGITPPTPSKKERVLRPFSLVEDIFKLGQQTGEFKKDFVPKEYVKVFISFIQGATLVYVSAPKEIQQKMKFPKADILINSFIKEKDNEQN